MKLTKILLLLITVWSLNFLPAQAAAFDRSTAEIRLNTVLTALTTKIGQTNTYQLKIVKNKRFNAYALPNGTITVTIGALQALDDEALQVLLLHEMAHEVLNHPLSQKARSKCSNQTLKDYEIAADTWAAQMMKQYDIPLTAAEKFLTIASKLAPNSRWGFHPSYEVREQIFREVLTAK